MEGIYLNTKTVQSTEVVVIGVKKVSFEKDGKKVEGTKVYLADKDELSQNTSKGYLPAERWFTGFEKFEEFKSTELPGKYQMEYNIRLDGSKDNLIIHRFSFIENVTLGQ